jgi:hypothetical protein
MGRIHPNVLKLRKQKRRNGRRAYLTSKFSSIHVPRAVGKDALAQWPEAARPMLSYSDHMKGDNRFFDPFLKAVLPSVEYCLAKAEEEQALHDLIVTEECVDFFTVRDAPVQQYRLTIIFNRKKTVLYFIKADFLNKVVEKSKQYGSQERAMFDLQHNRVSWHYVLPLTSLHTVLPTK